jgi:hypothetical protein
VQTDGTEATDLHGFLICENLWYLCHLCFKAKLFWAKPLTAFNHLALNGFALAFFIVDFWKACATNL